MNFTRYGGCTKPLAGKKGYHFVALLKLYLLILVSLKLEFAIRSYRPWNLISTTGSLATSKLNTLDRTAQWPSEAARWLGVIVRVRAKAREYTTFFFCGLTKYLCFGIASYGYFVR